MHGTLLVKFNITCHCIQCMQFAQFWEQAMWKTRYNQLCEPFWNPGDCDTVSSRSIASWQCQGEADGQVCSTCWRAEDSRYPMSSWLLWQLFLGMEVQSLGIEGIEKLYYRYKTTACIQKTWLYSVEINSGVCYKCVCTIIYTSLSSYHSKLWCVPIISSYNFT